MIVPQVATVKMAIGISMRAIANMQMTPTPREIYTNSF